MAKRAMDQAVLSASDRPTDRLDQRSRFVELVSYPLIVSVVLLIQAILLWSIVKGWIGQE